MFQTSLLTAAISATCISAAAAATIDFHATMNGKSEVPPTNSAGSGNVQATLDTDTKQLNYTMTYKGLTGPVWAAHFHGPATAGENAGVVVPIGKDLPSRSKSTVTLTDAQMNDLEAGKWYANVLPKPTKPAKFEAKWCRANSRTPALFPSPKSEEQDNPTIYEVGTTSSVRCDVRQPVEPATPSAWRGE